MRSTSEIIHNGKTLAEWLEINETEDSDLRYANLSYANLRYASLSCANLSGANLSGADLRGANLSCANLRGANLSGANLSGANLSGANLRYASLSGADLSDANLSYADLRYASLSGANLSGASLRGADLSYASLSGADLRGANLSGAYLRGAEGLEQATALTSIVPETGAFEGYKKCNAGVIVKLRIPAKAKRSNATGRKCRAEFVRVLAVYGAEVGVTNTYGPLTYYRKGETVHCNDWDDNRWHECSGGIHFFITRWEAENYA